MVVISQKLKVHERFSRSSCPWQWNMEKLPRYSPTALQHSYFPLDRHKVWRKLMGSIFHHIEGEMIKKSLCRSPHQNKRDHHRLDRKKNLDLLESQEPCGGVAGGQGRSHSSASLLRTTEKKNTAGFRREVFADPPPVWNKVVHFVRKLHAY